MLKEPLFPATKEGLLRHSEYLYLEEVLAKFPDDLVAYVADSYDYFGFLTQILPLAKDTIMARNGKLVVRGDCYSSDTSILTDSGWKLFKDLTEEDLVAQVLDNDEYEFVKPLEIINKEYSGSMYHYKDGHGKVDHIVTPNHRMVYKQINPTTKKTVSKIVQAKSMKNQGNHLNYFESSAKIKSSNIKSLTLIEKLNIAFQADGSYTSNRSNNRIRFSFSKERKKVYLENLLKEGNISFDTYLLKDDIVEYNIHINSSLFKKDFSWVDTKNLCPYWCEEFLKELSIWDSWVRSENLFEYYTTNKDCKDVVELISISAGKGVLISEKEDLRSEKFSDIYIVSINDNNKLGGQSWVKTEIDYTGTIHCVTVPSGKILVKRNKSTLVCGNSGNPVEIICGIVVPDFSTEATLELAAYEAFIRNFDPEVKVELVTTLFSYKNKNYKSNYNVTFDSYELFKDWSCRSIKEYELTPEEKGTIEILWEIFGGTTNELGYKLLDSHIGMIYGDGITMERAQEIFTQLQNKGFASLNIVFGIGAYSLAATLSRDDLGIAVKATSATVSDGNETRSIPVYKEPKTDKSKKSAKGLLKVTYNADTKLYVLHDNVSEEESQEGELKTVFLNGNFTDIVSFTDIKTELYS